MDNKVIDIAFDTRKYILNICRGVLNDQYDLEQACDEIYNKWNLAYFPLDDDYYVFSAITSDIFDYVNNRISMDSPQNLKDQVQNEIDEILERDRNLIKLTCQDLITKYAI